MKGDRLAELRKDRKYTQEELAETLGVSKYTISSYETEKTEPSDGLKVQMAKLFNVSLDYLLGLIKEPVPYERGREYVIVDQELTDEGRERILDYIEYVQDREKQIRRKKAREEKAQKRAALKARREQQAVLYQIQKDTQDLDGEALTVVPLEIVEQSMETEMIEKVAETVELLEATVQTELPATKEKKKSTRKSSKKSTKLEAKVEEPEEIMPAAEIIESISTIEETAEEVAKPKGRRKRKQTE